MCNIPERVKSEIISFAKQYEIDKVYLFGSRARGDNHERSDIDLAFCGGIHTDEFRECLMENLWTLLKVDVICLDEMPDSFVTEVEKEGIILYEKI